MKKKVMIGVLAVLVILVGLSVYLYQTIRSPLSDGAEEASAYLLDNGAMQTIEDVSFYHGGEGYWVARGIDDSGEPVFAWVNQDQDQREDTLVMPTADGVPKDEIIAQVSDQLNVGSFDTVRLGLEDGRPVYEFSYTSNEQGKVFYYASFETGDYFKSYSIRTNP